MFYYNSEGDTGLKEVSSGQTFNSSIMLRKKWLSKSCPFTRTIFKKFHLSHFSINRSGVFQAKNSSCY